MFVYHKLSQFVMLCTFGYWIYKILTGIWSTLKYLKGLDVYVYIVYTA
jgi:hypothetical protein